MAQTTSSAADSNPVDRSVLTTPGLTHERRYIGTTDHVDEYIGPDLVNIAISFERADRSSEFCVA